MNFEQLKDEVQAIVKRPDLDSRVESAIRAATLKAHQSDYYFNDLVEVAVEFDEARYIQTFDPRQVVPRYRHPKYVRIWEGDAATGVPLDFLEHIHIEAALDTYGHTRTNVFYMAGAFLQIRTSKPVRRVLFGSYRHPTVTPSNAYDSWIADEYPWAIIYEAARTVFLQTGFQEQSASMRSLVQEEYAVLGISNVDAIPT